MASVIEIRNRLLRITLPVARQEVAKLVVRSEEVIKAKKAELKAGLRPDGNIIGTYKSEEYKQEKLLQNPSAGGTVDLIKDGNFSNNLFIQNPRQSEFSFESTDEKSKMLFDKYGDDIRSLNEKTFLEVWNLHIKGDYIKALKKITGL